MLRETDPVLVNRRKAKQAALAIRKVYGPNHHKAAGTCIDTLHLLMRKARNNEVRGLTQLQLAKNFKWSHGTFGRYTRVLENMGLIDIERTHNKKGWRKPNGYILTFLMEAARRFGLGRYYDEHPYPWRLYNMDAPWGVARPAPI